MCGVSAYVLELRFASELFINMCEGLIALGLLLLWTRCYAEDC